MILRYQPRRALSLLVGIAATVLMTLPLAPARAQDDPVIAKVNGIDIRQSDLALAEEDLGQNIPPQAQGDAKREYLIGYLTDVILVAKAAEDKKVADQSDFKTRLAYA